MPPLKQPREELIIRAAELRAAGLTWEAVAVQIGRAADTVRRWPNLYPELWQRMITTAERQLLTEATAEAVLTLRKHLRSADEKISRDAAQRLIQFRVALDQRLKARKPASQKPPSDLQRVAAYLEALSDDQREQILDELVSEALAERTAPGESATAAGS